MKFSTIAHKTARVCACVKAFWRLFNTTLNPLITNKKITSGGRRAEGTLQGGHDMTKVEKRSVGSIPAHAICAFWSTNTVYALADLAELPCRANTIYFMDNKLQSYRSELNI